jgi:hypothetical protein
MELGAGASNGATSLSLIDPVGSTALATTDLTLTIAGANGTYTVTSDSFGALPPHTPDAVTISPPLSITTTPPAVAKPLKAKDAVTVSTATDTPYRTVSDASISGSTVTSATASFVNSAYPAGDVGAPFQGELGGTHGSGGTAVVSGITGSPLTITAVNSSTSVTLSSPAEQETSAGPPPTYAPISGTNGTVTFGQTLAAPHSLYTVQNLLASNCGSSANATGEFAPLTANMVGISTGVIPNSALALEAAPPAQTFSITYPAIGSGWADAGGYPNSASQPTTSLAFPGGKDSLFSLTGGQGACPSSANCDSMIKGTATGDWPTTKGSLGLAAGGLIFCTLGQSQAIAGTPNNGGPDNTNNGGSIHTGANPAVVCDGASGNAFDSSESTALGVVITLELNPNANAYGTDNTPPISIWEVVAAGASNLVL